MKHSPPTFYYMPKFFPRPPPPSFLFLFFLPDPTSFSRQKDATVKLSTSLHLRLPLAEQYILVNQTEMGVGKLQNRVLLKITEALLLPFCFQNPNTFRTLKDITYFL